MSHKYLINLTVVVVKVLQQEMCKGYAKVDIRMF